MKTSGIYSITNITNGKVYIGSAVWTWRRWRQHRNFLRKNKHSNVHLQNSWNKYGEQSFKFEVIEEVTSEKLELIEQQYLDKIRLTPDRYYNLATNVDSPRRGVILSEETKRKMSKANMGHKHSDETKRKIKEKRKFQIQSEDQRRRFSEFLKSDKNPSLDKKIYTFKNLITSETYTGIQRDFYVKYNLIQSCVSSLSKGKRPAHRNWVLVDTYP